MKITAVLIAMSLMVCTVLSGCGTSPDTGSAAPSPGGPTKIGATGASGAAAVSNGAVAKLNSQVAITSFQFVNRNQGWAVGYQHGRHGQTATVWETNDSGSTWRATPLAGFSPEYIHMTNARQGWLVGLSGIGSSEHIAMLETLDGGRTWQPEQTFKLKPGLSPEETVNSLSTATQMVFNSNRSGWLVIQGDLYHTTDSGNGWRRTSQPGGIAGIGAISHDIFAIGFSHIWEWDSHNSTWALRYTLPQNLQRTFYGPQSPSTYPVYQVRNQITFSSPRAGYAVFISPDGSMQGQEYLLAHSRNGGHSWNTVGGSFNNPKNHRKTRELPAGYIVGIHSVPGGDVFIGLSLPFPYPMLGVLSANHTWSWICAGLHAPPGWVKGTLRATQWLTSNSGWAVVQTPIGRNTLLHTDGGRNNWVDITPR